MIAYKWLKLDNKVEQLIMFRFIRADKSGNYLHFLNFYENDWFCNIMV